MLNRNYTRTIAHQSRSILRDALNFTNIAVKVSSKNLATLYGQTDGTVLLAGTPIAEDGTIVTKENVATVKGAIGIVYEDVVFDESKFGFDKNNAEAKQGVPVVIMGCVDLDLVKGDGVPAKGEVGYGVRKVVGQTDVYESLRAKVHEMLITSVRAACKNVTFVGTCPADPE